MGLQDPDQEISQTSNELNKIPAGGGEFSGETRGVESDECKRLAETYWGGTLPHHQQKKKKRETANRKAPVANRQANSLLPLLPLRNDAQVICTPRHGVPSW